MPPRVRAALARAGAIYLVLYLVPAPLGQLPWLSRADEVFHAATARAMQALARHVLHLAVSPTLGSTSDAAWCWLRLACIAMIALVGALVWTWRRPEPHPRLKRAFIGYLRIALACEMVAFGAAKVLYDQFGPMPVPRLFLPVGEQSPMGLLWSFMGFSWGYNLFVGSAELVGGALLLWSRTMSAGALALVAVLANVVALDLAYDVPVKIGALHDLVIALVLVAPALPGVLAALAGRKAARTNLTPLVLIVAVVLVRIGEKRENLRFDVNDSPFAGMWNVETMSRDGVELPPRLDDPTRWRRVAFFGPRFIVLGMDEEMLLTANASADADTLLVTPDRDRARPFSLHVARAGDRLTLDGQGLHVVLRWFDPAKTRRYGRGFRWVSEGVYNY